MDRHTLQNCFENYAENRLAHRYICNDHILPLLDHLGVDFLCKEIGRSVNEEPIFCIRFGTGSVKILLWSQMHGNESTTTKAIFDVLSSIKNDKKTFQRLLDTCDIAIIPILNPDGARAYSRVNANSIDLNRDAKHLSQPESNVLRNLFNEFKPQYCFNLHGQRTIFSVTEAIHPATLSFLAPAQDQERSVTDTRKVAMSIISSIYDYHQGQLSNQIGRYDDTHNANCVGDTFQALGVPTVLFEAGHYANDYARDKTRQYIFESLCIALHTIAEGVDTTDYKRYFEIPENEKKCYDVIIRDVNAGNKSTSIAIQYEERLRKGEIQFIPKVVNLDLQGSFKGHLEITANNHDVLTHEGEALFEGYENDFVLINHEKYSLKA